MEIGERIKMVREAQPGKKKMNQTKFGEILGVTRDAMANIELGRVEPTDLFIKHLCATFDVSEEWLREGKGEMNVTLSRSEEIARFAGRLMKEDDDSFRKRLLEALAQLSESEWAVLEGIAEKLAQKKD